MEKKICSKCKIEYLIDNFHLRTPNGNYRSHCKFCIKEYKNNKYKLNKEEEKLKSKLYREENKNIIQQRKKVFYKKNKDKPYYNYKEYRKQNPEKVKQTQNKYKKNNKDTISLKSREWRKNNPTYTSDRKKNDSVFKLAVNMRSRLRIFMKKSSKIKKTNKTFEYVGCSPEQLKEHIEKQFVNGMNWENYSLHGWHIDHIIPLSSAKTDEDVYKLCHYTNLQPLWAKDNISKGNKIQHLLQ
jgi:hypothetical protein